MISRQGSSSSVAFSAVTACNTSAGHDNRDPYVMDFTCKCPSNWDLASSSSSSSATHNTGEKNTACCCTSSFSLRRHAYVHMAVAACHTTQCMFLLL
jgi:hypothetical protein